LPNPFHSTTNDSFSRYNYFLIWWRAGKIVPMHLLMGIFGGEERKKLIISRMERFIEEHEKKRKIERGRLKGTR